MVTLCREIVKLIFKRLAKEPEIKKERIYRCSHCKKEISYEEYRYQCELCQSCAEASCMG